VSPILDHLERRLGVSRIVAAGLTFLTGLAVLAVFGFSIWLSVLDLSRQGTSYRQRIRELVQEVEERLPFRVSSTQASISSTEAEGDPAEVSGVSTADAKVSNFIDVLVRDGISAVSQSLVTLVSTSVVVLIFVFFLLIGSPAIHGGNATIHEINQQVRSYLALKTVISIFTGLAFGLALRIFGVPMPFTFGVLAFLLNFIPNVGPIVATLLPIPLIIFDPQGSLLWMVAAIGVASAIQLISGNLIEPKMMGDASDLHPVTVLLALMFWGMMWGVIGMFLATPITAALKIMLQRIDQTRPVADLMAGRLGREQILERVAQGREQPA
jgi:AI-2 transport protein TqsA